MVQERIRATHSSYTPPNTTAAQQTTSQDTKVQEALAMGHALVTVQVPNSDVGLIIGKAGVTIKVSQKWNV
jgi:hypothetical protein